ncbi:MAG: hypothetical protein L6R43_15380 [Planctomycetes bacterium]|nr:hypothetical protein [Planctomycetota bacterium]
MFLCWLLLLAICWPLAVLAGLMLLPLALAGMVLGATWLLARGTIDLATALLSLPFRVVGIGRPRHF